MKVKNALTGATREIKSPSLKVLERDLFDGLSKCTGPCRCTIEPDGVCAAGWPSRMIAAGAM